MQAIDVKSISPGLFTSPPADYMLQSIREGYTPARAWSNAPSFSLWAVLEGHTLFFDGEDSPRAMAEAVEYVGQSVLDDKTRGEVKVLKILWGNEAWRPLLTASFARHNPAIYPRYVYRYDEKTPPGQRQFPAVRALTRELLEDETVSNREMVAEEIFEMWGGLEPFFGDGFGMCTVLDGGIAGFCTAEYISASRCGIGIAVEEAHRRKGYALAMTEAFVAESLRRGITAHWDCWKNNTASVQTARKAGFSRIAEYDVLFVSF